jgi:hypothetical protein
MKYIIKITKQTMKKGWHTMKNREKEEKTMKNNKQIWTNKEK